MSARHRAEGETERPATLYGVMQAAIAEGLQERYKPPQRMSHELFVLMMQINEQAKAK
jgi:hypothetical protein